MLTNFVRFDYVSKALGDELVRRISRYKFSIGRCYDILIDRDDEHRVCRRLFKLVSLRQESFTDVY